MTRGDDCDVVMDGMVHNFVWRGVLPPAGGYHSFASRKRMHSSEKISLIRKDTFRFANAQRKAI